MNNARRMYWLVVLEGIAYTILAVMDFFIHTRAADLSAMTAFKVVDIVIGAPSGTSRTPAYS